MKGCNTDEANWYVRVMMPICVNEKLNLSLIIGIRQE